MAEKKAHPGFEKVQSSIEKKEGVSKESAGAILASAARKASPAAVKANPHLKAVSGVTEKKKHNDSMGTTQGSCSMHGPHSHGYK